ncbi:FAD-binding oxidoreductase [Nocardia sp. CDC159]|uniref:FAD-binding oxidoreductase n=1 Tax=Nocardia pulmonis TaxID=2951408 RepID=A0A9X2IY41_9NOCA|nr:MULTISPECIES: FAD-binding oxidoreductase [Nocardia]MCM6776662.1 FAD-binding oxidoreductase [Nocardia pulmonis]MCM6789189.1 FAD-binding oxidoreductase [Nocardia sp. CDC159]
MRGAADKPESVLVIGAGIAGLTIAHQLSRQGIRVTVCDGVGVGAGASWGNAGWVNPIQAGPMPEPQVVLDSVRHLGSGQSSTKIAMRDIPGLAGWLLAFLRNCTPARYRRAAGWLAELGRTSVADVEQLAEDGVVFTHRRGELLAVARDPRLVDAFLAARKPLCTSGLRLPSTVLTGSELRDLEPILSSRITAGVRVEDHLDIDSASLLRGLSDHLRDRGVIIAEGVTATEVRAVDGRADAVVTDQGDYRSDAVVVATGAIPNPLYRGFPMIGARGYSFDVAARRRPGRSVLLLGSHIACVPRDGRVRIAGGVDFGPSARLSSARLDAMVALAEPSLVGVDWGDRRNEWTGQRPVTPDGLPVVDRLPPYSNVFVATGYATLGMTLAASIAVLVARWIVEGERAPVLAPFRVDRFR